MTDTVFYWKVIYCQGRIKFFEGIYAEMPEEAAFALHKLAGFLFKHYKKKVIILWDEYDTPKQEAYVYGYWDELVAFTRSF